MVNFEREYQPLRPGTNILVMSRFSCMPDQILGKKMKKLNFWAKMWPLFRVFLSQNKKERVKKFVIWPKVSGYRLGTGKISLKNLYPFWSYLEKTWRVSKWPLSPLRVKIDANNTFWQRKLSDDSCLLTKFVTPGEALVSIDYSMVYQQAVNNFRNEWVTYLRELKVPSVKWMDDSIVHGLIKRNMMNTCMRCWKRPAEANVTLNLANVKLLFLRLKF